MFWMIDDMFQPHDAHIGDNWISYYLKKREPLLDSWQVSRCLFGLHLLCVTNKPICVVESEQSAVILSEILPESVWMAYVTLSNLTPDLLAPLQGRTVTIYPRTDPTQSTYLFFLDYADIVRHDYPTIQLHVEDILENEATDEQKQRCIDLLDFLMEQ